MMVVEVQNEKKTKNGSKWKYKSKRQIQIQKTIDNKPISQIESGV